MEKKMLFTYHELAPRPLQCTLKRYVYDGERVLDLVNSEGVVLK